MGKNNLVNKTQKDKYTTRKEVLTSFFLGSEYELSTKKQIASFFAIPKGLTPHCWTVLHREWPDIRT